MKEIFSSNHVYDGFLSGLLANIAVGLVSALLLLVHVVPVDMDSPVIDLENDYKLVFQDEFNGDELNREVWGPHNKPGIRKGGYWTPDQSFVEDGCLHIRTQYLEDGEFGAGWYTSGLCTGKSYTHKYGYYECRAKLPRGEGLWSAFWMMNQNVNKGSGTGKRGAEIDIFESPFSKLKGEKSWRVTSNIHYNGYGLKTKYKNVCIPQLDNDPYENFNTYGLLWTQDEYIYFVNGHEVGRSDFGGVSEEPEFMILSCEVEGAQSIPTWGWSGRIDHNDKDTFFADFLVDYVRVYDPVEPA